MSVHDARDVIPAVYSTLDEPLGDASLIPTFMLSRMTRKYITVALGGDGGDELLYGYQTFIAHRLARGIKAVPATLRRAVFQMLSRLPVSEDYFSVGFKLHRFIKGWDINSFAQDTLWRGSFDSDARAQLFSKEFFATIHDKSGLNPTAQYEDVRGRTFLSQLSRMYCETYLPDDILVKVDRASMMNSLEVRAPFLDHRLAQCAYGLPDRYKLRGLTGKWLLKHVMKGKLPDDIITRAKKGFALPIASWLRGDLKPLGEELLESGYLRRQGIFNPAYVRGLWERHQTGRGDYRKELWTLLAFQLWYEHHMRPS